MLELRVRGSENCRDPHLFDAHVSSRRRRSVKVVSHYQPMVICARRPLHRGNSPAWAGSLQAISVGVPSPDHAQTLPKDDAGRPAVPALPTGGVVAWFRSPSADIKQTDGARPSAESGTRRERQAVRGRVSSRAEIRPRRLQREMRTSERPLDSAPAPEVG